MVHALVVAHPSPNLSHPSIHPPDIADRLKRDKGTENLAEGPLAIYEHENFDVLWSLVKYAPPYPLHCLSLMSICCCCYTDRAAIYTMKESCPFLRLFLMVFGM